MKLKKLYLVLDNLWREDLNSSLYGVFQNEPSALELLKILNNENKLNNLSFFIMTIDGLNTDF